MRILSLFAALAMVAGLFLPWLKVAPGADGLVPWRIVRDIPPEWPAIQEFAAANPPELLAFLATFAVAGLFALLALIGAPSRLLALVAGGGAAGLVGWGLMRMKDQAAALGIPLPTAETLIDYAKASPEVFGMGAFLWAGGALVLLLMALIGFPER